MVMECASHSRNEAIHLSQFSEEMIEVAGLPVVTFVVNRDINAKCFREVQHGDETQMTVDEVLLAKLRRVLRLQ